MTDPTRRTVLEAGLAGAVASAAGPVLAQSFADRVGVAVVGLGKLSQGQIIPGFRHCRSARLAALVSGDSAKAGRIAAEQGLDRQAIYDYAGFDRIANDPSIEVVYVVLPNFMHAEYAIRALRAGKHVLCEKPMATTVADAERIVAQAKRARRRLMIAYRCHYEPLNVEAMRRIRAGSIGRPRMVWTNMGRQADLSDPSDAWRLDGVKSGGGALADMGIYGINGARYLLNEEPVELRAWERTDRRDPRFRTVEDLVAWEFRFPSGAIASGSTSFNQSGTMSWEVTGERGRLVADPGCFYSGNRLVAHAADGGEVKAREIDQFAREMDWMADVVRGRAPIVSPDEDGLQDMRLIRAILDSAARGGAIVRTDWAIAARSIRPPWSRSESRPIQMWAMVRITLLLVPAMLGPANAARRGRLSTVAAPLLARARLARRCRPSPPRSRSLQASATRACWRRKAS